MDVLSVLGSFSKKNETFNSPLADTYDVASMTGDIEAAMNNLNSIKKSDSMTDVDS